MTKNTENSLKNAGKIPEKFPKILEKLQEAFLQKGISFLGHSHGCQFFKNSDFPGNKYQNFSFFGNFPLLLKIKMGLKKLKNY